MRIEFFNTPFGKKIDNFKDSYSSVSKFDFVLVLVLLIFSGNPAPAIPFGWEPLLVGLAIVIVSLLIKFKKPVFEHAGIGPLGMFLLICISQVLVFMYFPYISIAGFLMRLFISYAVVRLVENFVIAYINVMTRLCQASLFFWIVGKLGLIKPLLAALSPLHLNPWTGHAVYPLLLHTYHTDQSLNVLRNSGMFWEPGAFAGYILLSMIFIALGGATIGWHHHRQNLFWSVVTLLSTLSTTGYIVLPFAILLGFRHVGSNKRERLKRGMLLYLFVIAVVILGFTAFNRIEFVYQKVRDQAHKALETPYSEIGFNNTRFGTAVFDWQYIKSSPLIGSGLHERTRYWMHPGSERTDGQGNGLTDFTAKFGFLGLGAFSYFTFFGLNKVFRQPMRSFFALLLIVAMLNGEQFLNFPLFMGLMFFKCARITYPLHYENKYQLTQKLMGYRY